MTIRRSQPFSVARHLGEPRAQGERALDHARARRRVGGARDRGQRQQRRDVADGVAPRGVHERRGEREVGARVRFGLGRDQDRAGRSWPSSPPAWPRSRPRARSRPGRRRLAGPARPRRRRAGGLPTAPRRPSPRARWCRSRSTTTVSVSRIISAARSASGSARIGATSPGSARIISSMAHGGPSRSSGMSDMDGHGTVSVALPTEPLRCRSTEPLWSCSPRWTAPRRRRCVISWRTRSAPPSPTAARRRARSSRPRGAWPRRCTSRAVWCPRPTRRSPPRAGSRSAAAPRPSSGPPRRPRRTRTGSARAWLRPRGST